MASSRPKREGETRQGRESCAMLCGGGAWASELGSLSEAATAGEWVQVRQWEQQGKSTVAVNGEWVE